MLRLRLAEELAFQSAPADEQLDFMARHNWDAMELLKLYLNQSSVLVPQLAKAGLLSPRVVECTETLEEALLSLDRELAEEYRRTGAIEALTPEGIRQDPRWEVIRVIARRALDALKDLGVSAPDLLDPKYNRPVFD